MIECDSIMADKGLIYMVKSIIIISIIIIIYIARMINCYVICCTICTIATEIIYRYNVFHRVMFWSEIFLAGSRISKANYDGTNEVEIFNNGLAMVEDIVFDVQNGM